MSLNNVEKFKAKMDKGQICIGTCISAPDPCVSELFADTGYDFTWIDTEHNPLSGRDTLGHVMAARGTDLAPLVRVPWNDPVLIKPILEFEPAGIIIPLIRTAADAELAVKACKYPPRGIRGYGPGRGVGFGAINTQDYLKDADSKIMVIVQVEHIDAVNNLDAILDTPDLDAVALGPNDLSGSLGMLGQSENPEVAKHLDSAAKKVRDKGLYLGVATGYSPENVKRWIDKGVQWMSLNGDYANLYLQTKTVVNGAKAVIENIECIYSEQSFKKME